MIFIKIALGAESFYDIRDNIVELTSENFKQFVTSSNRYWIVEIYATWCELMKFYLEFIRLLKENIAGGFSQEFVPEYTHLGNEVRFANDISVGAVEESENRDLVDFLEVESFPTIKFFIGTYSEEYDGERTARDIIREFRKFMIKTSKFKIPSNHF